MSVEFQLEEPALIEKDKDIFEQGIPYTTGKEFLKIVPEFADIILVLSDAAFPSIHTYAMNDESFKIKKKHEVLSCHCGVLGRHVIFFCNITEDNGQQAKKFNLIFCPMMQSEFIKSLKGFAMQQEGQQQKPLQLMLMGKHAYEFHLDNVKESYSILEAGHRLKSEIKRVPHLMRNFVRCNNNIDLSAVAFDYYQNSLYQEVFFDTFEVVKNYCPICSIKK